jgi:RimJ/RimL family protein N-acetyltransferase
MTIIREIRVADAPAFLALRRALDDEARYLLLEPGERRERVAKVEERLRDVREKANKNIFVVEDDGALVGYLSAIGGDFRRIQKRAHIVVALREAYTGRGLGTRLFERMEVWARDQQLHRLELTVLAENRRALGLYLKLGFRIEGNKRDSFWIDDHYVDELCLAKLLG